MPCLARGARSPGHEHGFAKCSFLPRPPWGSILVPPALRIRRNGLATAIPIDDRGLRPLDPPNPGNLNQLQP
jgi:hypothetical protein